MILYVKAGCPWCRLVEEHLNKRGYKYERTDVRLDRSAFDELTRITRRRLSSEIWSCVISGPMSLKIF